MNSAVNLLKSNTPYMLRKDGTLLECGEAHPYIKYYFEWDDIKNMSELDKHPESLEWFFNNTQNNEAKQLINKYKKEKDVETFNKLNDLLNNEFCRVRTSNIKYKYGGENGAIYFRISSEGFNWFDLIWQTVMDYKDVLKDVTVVRDQQTFGKQFDYYKHKGKELKHIPVDEFLTLSGNPIIEKLYKSQLKTDHQGRKWCYLFFNFLKDKYNEYYRVLFNTIYIEAEEAGMKVIFSYEFRKDGKVNVYKDYDLINTFSSIEDFLDCDEYKLTGPFPYIDTKELYEYIQNNLVLDEKIIQIGDKWQVQSEKGRNLGTYDNKNEAEKRLQQVEYFKHLNEELDNLLLEKKRSELISKSKSGANYKSKERKNQNRWDRRVYSKLSTSVSDYNKIDMNTFWKEDFLEFGVKVRGETDNYVVTVTFERVLDRLADEIKRNNNKLEFKNVLRALINTFNSEDVYVACSCPDWVYSGNNYYSYRQGYNSDPKFGPAMDAPVIRNPGDNLGAGCKHINLVLSNLTWIMKIASVINNYIWYCKDNMELNYAKYIFPKLYGMNYDKAIQLTLFDTDELQTDEEIINLSNALGRRRTQFKPKGIEGGNPRFERERKEKPLANPLKLQFKDEEEEEEIKIREPEPELGNEDEEIKNERNI